MSGSSSVCEIDPELKAKLRKFRFRKETTNGAIVMKVDKAALLVKVDEEYDDIPLDELAEELPTSQPRFVVYSYKYEHKDGRLSYPLCFIFYSPEGCSVDLNMMYAGSKTSLTKEADIGKIFEVRSTEDITEEWLKSKLGFFQ
ncbi:glia maturation factor gamma-like [Sycon ciliatum]|uniref:glia maturation factor gamma-like n=1 Tax=Sycon ciliatum TaxID=27933 RepID=UPI0020AD9963|eukprot:scpid93344/ scgid18927/ Glia maturation factor gamma